MTTVTTLLTDQVLRAPEAPVICVHGRELLTYRRLWDEVVALQALLGELGRDDRIAVVMPDGPELAVAILAITGRAICVPLNPVYSASEIEQSLRETRARALLLTAGDISPARAAAAAGVPVIEAPPVGSAPSASSPEQDSTQPGDVAVLLGSSGTTARPKQVPLTHATLCAIAGNIVRAFSLTPNDRCLNWMPLFHTSGMIGSTLSSLYAGGSVIYTPTYDPPRYFALLREFRPTWSYGGPAMLMGIYEHALGNPDGVAGHTLRFIRSSAADFPEPTRQGLEALLGIPVLNTYGLTEASACTAMPLPPAARKPGSVGVSTGPAHGIMGEDGALLPPNVPGEIVLRGPGVFSAYMDDAEATRLAFRDGWFRTGDLGYLDEDGHLFLTGRLREMINRGGEKIAPFEVERVLLDHPAVARAVAFGVPHPQLGETVAAAVVPRAAVTAGELRDFAAARLAYFKVPAPILLVEELPANPMGKLSRAALAAYYGLAGGEAQPHGSEEELERLLEELEALSDEEAARQVIEQVEDVSGDAR
ncbi:MAG: AMP-binding protein [Armatimonadota bacterium]